MFDSPPWHPLDEDSMTRLVPKPCSPRLVFILAFVLLGVGAGCGDDGPTKPKVKQTRILFSSPDAAASSEVWIMNADGSDQLPITQSANISGYPSWSPDGQRILFTRWWTVGGTNVWSGIFRMNANGSGVTCLDSIPDTYFDTPHYSPDGSKILTEASARIYVMNAEGSNRVDISPDPAGGINPEWSPDGSRIIFSRPTPYGYRIYTMKSDGTDTLKVLETGVPSSNQVQPTYSPDGRTIAYTDDHGFHGGIHDYTWIDVVASDGTNIRHVSPLTDVMHSEPCWSPDGKRIVYRADLFPADLFSVNPDGTDPVNVTNTPNTYELSPAWGPAVP